MDKGRSGGDELSSDEMATLLSILAKEYKTTTASLLQKLNLVSGDLNALHRLLTGDKTVEWSPEEDDLLAKNSELLKRWKGNEQAELRRKYVAYKVK
jgi:hypothetical protein